ncbi:preprotein translocase subunit YajC [Lactobacillus sp. ESL0680]|uniref:preprotein translocase subunit YajC n=1 Tax=Lactobacillus sp. ESL0680 TaxID=2983210 RepID=UPI0023F97257|nr:preprotein translocase subunit YajC [Lactobacillus sp. ESL0680]WEV38251.1 preprotein translocase subunit YajC [Lactobacillus sp. ESL0680]
MNTLFLAAAGNGNSSFVMIIIFIVLIAFMYFTMIKPQKKQQQKKMEMMNQLKKGDNVILIDGLHAKIDSVDTNDKTVVVDADGIYLTFSRMAVQQILPAAEANTTEKPAEEEPAKEEKPVEPADKPTEAEPKSDDDSTEE